MCKKLLHAHPILGFCLFDASGNSIYNKILLHFNLVFGDLIRVIVSIVSRVLFNAKFSLTAIQLDNGKTIHLIACTTYL